MPWFDTHCHYNLEPLFSGQTGFFTKAETDPIYQQNWRQHLFTALEHQVIGGIIVGADLINSRQAVMLSQAAPQLLSSVGLHPDVIVSEQQAYSQTRPNHTLAELTKHLNHFVETQIAELAELIASAKIVAIGEAGCDYYAFGVDQNLNQVLRQAQLQLFQSQVALAIKHDLPLIIHTRDKQEQAYWDALQVIQESHCTQPFVLHCVSGPLAYIAKALDRGGFVGFDGNLTYSKADSLLKILELVPTNRIMLETDAPFLPPTPYRGKICEPWMVAKTGEFLCQTKPISPEQLLQNTSACFGDQVTQIIRPHLTGSQNLQSTVQ